MAVENLRTQRTQIAGFIQFFLFLSPETSDMKHLILASQSPRRRQLLADVGLTFQVQSVSTEETYPGTMPLSEIAACIAKGKAEALWATLDTPAQGQSIILACDTVVASNERVLGKPKGREEAAAFLRLLSGGVHEVITGVFLLSSAGQYHFSTTTKVHFRELTEAQIAYYVSEYKPFDKAGAYAIQEWIGMVGIKKIEGDYYNVVGLPVGEVVKALKSFCPDIDGLI